jgi:hypothetical protein
MVELTDFNDLVDHIRFLLAPYSVTVRAEDVRVELCDSVPDTRLGWERTYIVSLKNYGVVGFTDSGKKKLKDVQERVEARQ